jgi:hypothetical protein
MKFWPGHYHRFVWIDEFLTPLKKWSPLKWGGGGGPFSVFCPQFIDPSLDLSFPYAATWSEKLHLSLLFPEIEIVIIFFFFCVVIAASQICNWVEWPRPRDTFILLTETKILEQKNNRNKNRIEPKTLLIQPYFSKKTI